MSGNKVIIKGQPQSIPRPDKDIRTERVLHSLKLRRASADMGPVREVRSSKLTRAMDIQHG